MKETHATLLLVPSLSPKTTAHRVAAADLAWTRSASTFVCNRWLDDSADGDRPSFCTLAGSRATPVEWRPGDRHLFRLTPSD